MDVGNVVELPQIQEFDFSNPIFFSFTFLVRLKTWIFELFSKKIYNSTQPPPPYWVVLIFEISLPSRSSFSGCLEA